jgi:iron complex outermembrane receptor protein
MTKVDALGGSSEGSMRSIAAAVRTVLIQHRSCVAVMSTAAFIMAGADAVAQQTEPRPAQSTVDSNSLTEIVVTAQRRSQTVPDIPYKISVVSGTDIANSGAATINDLTRNVAGLVTVDNVMPFI